MKPNKFLGVALAFGAGQFAWANPQAQPTLSPKPKSSPRTLQNPTPKLSPKAIGSPSPTPRKATSSKKSKKALPPAEVESPWSRAETFLARREFAQAKEQLLRISPQDINRDHALELLALCELELGRYSQAKTHLISVMTEHPYASNLKSIPDRLGVVESHLATQSCAKSTSERCQSSHQKAFIRLSQNGHLNLTPIESIQSLIRSCTKKTTPLCNTWLDRLLGTFPKNSPEFKIIQTAFPKLNRSSSSSFVGERLTVNYRESSTSEPDQELLTSALQSIQKKQSSEAIKTLELLLNQFPKSGLRQRARFLLGTLYRSEKKLESAQSLFQKVIEESPFSFAAVLSSFASKKPIMDALIQADSKTVDLTQENSLSPIDRLRVLRAHELIKNHAWTASQEELDEIKPRDTYSNDTLWAIAALQDRGRAHRAAFVTLTELIQRQHRMVYSDLGLAMIFPTTRWSEIKSAAAGEKLDPILWISLIKQESAFDSQAQSASQALGFSQILYSTALELDPELNRRDLFKPATNLRLGARYLKKMMDRFDGNIAIALAAYNAGPNAVSRWIKEGLFQGPIELSIEQIPYKETRDYVGSIIRNYIWYQKLLGDETDKKGLDYFFKPVGTADE
jgi:tetratricopeptide (TPR) repeat protein